MAFMVAGDWPPAAALSLQRPAFLVGGQWGGVHEFLFSCCTEHRAMASKHRSRHEVRPSAGDHPPPAPKTLPPGVSKRPQLPEHIEVQAHKLIHDTGSPDAAKSAVDVVADRDASDFQEDHFAHRWGFASRGELRDASTALAPADGRPWWATRLKTGRWIVWNKENLAARETFASLNEAEQSLTRHEEDGESEHERPGR
jgi:hypothetical protein